MKSEHLNGAPLRLGDVRVQDAAACGMKIKGAAPFRAAAVLVDERDRPQVLVMSSGDAVVDVTANALLFLGAPRLYRALAGLLQASQASDLECGDRTREDAAMRVLTKAEGEAQAALTAAQPNDGRP